MAPEPALEVLDHGETVAITFPDLLQYHGRSSIAGLAHGFKALERVLPLLAGGSPPERYGIAVESAFPGPGTVDAFEMVTRAVTGERYRYAPDIAPAGAPPGPEGFFFYRFRYGDAAVDVLLREGMVGDEFVRLVRRGAQTPAEEETLTRMKREMADRLLALPAAQVYDAAAAPGVRLP